MAIQSTFVTVIAWLALIFSGFGSLVGVIQLPLVWFIMPVEPMSGEEVASTPVLFRLIFDNFHLFVLANTTFWVVTFVCALGLLRRRAWARHAFTALLVLGGTATTAMAAIQMMWTTEMFRDATAPAEATTMIATMRAGTVILAVVLVSGFGFVAWRLNTRAVRDEFR